MAFGGGWHVRGTIAENDALRSANAALEALAQARERAEQAAAGYAAARDALQPQIRIVRVQADSIVRELVSCPMPVGADRLLDRAADLADTATSAGNAASPSIESRARH